MSLFDEKFRQAFRKAMTRPSPYKFEPSEELGAPWGYLKTDPLASLFYIAAARIAHYETCYHLAVPASDLDDAAAYFPGAYDNYYLTLPSDFDAPAYFSRAFAHYFAQLTAQSSGVDLNRHPPFPLALSLDLEPFRDASGDPAARSRNLEKPSLIYVGAIKQFLVWEPISGSEAIVSGSPEELDAAISLVASYHAQERA